MPALIAIATTGGDRFVELLRSVWDDGDAALPLDPRLPPPALALLLDDLRPAAVVDADGGRSRREGAVPVDEGDALVVATSGSTGRPKGVVLSHDAVAASASATSARLGVDPASDRWLACLPLSHVGGLSVVTRSLVTGTPLTVLPGFDAAAVEDEARRGATRVSLVATALGRIDASLFRTILLGGAAPPAQVPVNVVTTYGMTETDSGVVYDGLPLDGVEVRASAGELQVRGPMLLRCYRDGTDPKAPGGWFPTGDAGAVEPDGRVTVHGRLADLVITGGENVWPAPVEAALATHPGVSACVVGGVADPEWGQRVVAWVVPSLPDAPPTLDELRAHVKVTLPATHAPRQVVLVDHLPRTPSGKLHRPEP